MENLDADQLLGIDLRSIPQPSSGRRARIRSVEIPRERLLRLMDSQWTTQALLVLAPAGFGKSTLLMHWIDHRGDPAVWFALNRHCHDLPGFLRHLLRSLQASGLVTTTRLEPLVRGPEVQDIETIVQATLADLHGAVQEMVIIIDDYHLVDDQTVHDLVAELVENLPDHVRLIISSREPPPLPLARWRVGGLTDLITAEDLRLTDGEAETFLRRRLSASISDRVRDALRERLDGWVAGLEMAALAIDRRPPDDFDPVLDHFGSDDLVLREYLLDEVLSRQRPDVRRFLLQTAVCDQLCRDLCVAIVGSADGATLLEEVQRAGLFVVPLGVGGEWFRYHQLFSDFLRTRLRRESDIADIQRVHRRACEWLSSRGMIDEAITHAIAAHDWPLASRLIKPDVVSLFELDRNDAVCQWLEKFPSEMLVSDPELSFYLSYALARLGRNVDAARHVERAERSWEDAGMTEGLAATTIVRGAIARFRADGPELVAQATRGLRLMTGHDLDNEPHDPAQSRLRTFSFSGMAGRSNFSTVVQLGVGYRLLGQPERAAPILQEAYAHRLATGSLATAVAPLTELAAVWMQQGRLHQAHDGWVSVINGAGSYFATERRHALIHLAGLYVEWNRLDEAEAHLTEADEISRKSRAATLLPELNLAWAHLCWAQADDARAFDYLARSLEASVALGAPQIARKVAAIRARFNLQRGDLDQAMTWAWESGLRADDAPDYARFDEQLTLARVLIARDESMAAVHLLDRMLMAADDDGRYGDAVPVRIVKAMAYQDVFELDAAIDAIEPAIELAQRSSYAHSFLSEGSSMVRLLRVALRRGVSTAPAARLLKLAGESVTVSRVAHQELVEPISSREIDVLRLIAVGLSNKEIADELFISVSTVKRHITNIYGKLGVASRAEAIDRIRALNIL